MDKEHEKHILRNMVKTGSLLFACLLVGLFLIGIFVSGPAIRYDAKIAQQEASITKSYPDITQLHRHVFSYIVYHGKDASTYYWFNENGELLVKKNIHDLRPEEAQKQAEATYQMQGAQVSYGYGYKAPVYIVANETMEVYYDLDTLEEIYCRKKG